MSRSSRWAGSPTRRRPDDDAQRVARHHPRRLADRLLGLAADRAGGDDLGTDHRGAAGGHADPGLEHRPVGAHDRGDAGHRADRRLAGPRRDALRRTCAADRGEAGMRAQRWAWMWLLLACLLVSAAEAATVPWRGRPFQIIANEKSLPDFLRELLASQGLTAVMDPKVAGTISGK